MEPCGHKIKENIKDLNKILTWDSATRLGHKMVTTRKDNLIAKAIIL